MGVVNVLAKTAGVIGLGLIGYDSHRAGEIESRAYAKNIKAGALSERFVDDMKLDSPSTVKSEVKKGLFNYGLDENLSGFFTGIGGYLKGFTTMAVSNIVPAALSLGAVLTKGLASRLCGAGLVAYGGIFLAQEIFGIGKEK